MTVRFRASDVAAATGGRLVGPDVELAGAAFDSRSLRPGELFVALVADRDGHDFVDAAVAAGAPAVLVDRPAPAPTAIEVPDTGVALLDLARWARGRLDRAARVVGVTGSVGKTSTKDLLVVALGASRRVAANPASFNNDQGVPVTILGTDDGTEVLVVEMGMRGFGEIARLCEIARPDVGVVTTVGHAHTERVGGIDGVARAKSEIVTSLGLDGVAVLNADDDRVAAMATRAPGAVVTYGTSVDAVVRFSAVELDDLARPRFRVESPWGRFEVALSVSGVHMATNAAAALAVTGAIGADVAAAAEALATVEMSAMRMEIRQAPSGAVIVNDAYNANPTSMRAALEAVARMRADRRIAVLGPMAELDDPDAAHREVAVVARELGIEVVALGTAAYGIEPVDDPIAAIGDLGPGDVVLVKASRVARLERVASDLAAR